jgi:RNA polymerase sigma factor (sigma-70 family)
VSGREPFAHVVRVHGAAVHRFLVAMAGADRADDCWQETFLSALEAYPSLRKPERVRSWLFSIAHRKAVDSHRRAKRDVPVAEPPERAAPERPPHNGELWSLVRDLPPKQRAAVAHRFVADLPYRDVAEAMGTSEEAARRNVHEGLRALRRSGGEALRAGG